jgi:hypothetical protein
MDDNPPKPGLSAKFCGACWMCRYTRSCKKPNLFYRFCRMLQMICPNCHVANRELGQNFQQSRHFGGEHS